MKRGAIAKCGGNHSEYYARVAFKLGTVAILVASFQLALAVLIYKILNQYRYYMNSQTLSDFEDILNDHLTHLDRLRRWKDLGGRLVNYPEGETIDNFICRGETAVVNLHRAIVVLSTLDP